MDYINTAFTFPTVVFSVLLIIILFFWLITLFGFADIDLLDGDVELDVEATDGDANTSNSVFKFGFGDLPITVSLSLVIMLSWLVSIYIHALFSYLLGDGIVFYLVGAGMIGASVFIALPLAAIFARPLRRFFDSKETASKNDMLGMECVIATSKVTNSFGQARVTFQGAEQLIEVRVDDDQSAFTLGDTALLIEHNKDTHSYVIAAKPW